MGNEGAAEGSASDADGDEARRKSSKKKKRKKDKKRKKGRDGADGVEEDSSLQRGVEEAIKDTGARRAVPSALRPQPPTSAAPLRTAHPASRRRGMQSGRSWCS